MVAKNCSNAVPNPGPLSEKDEFLLAEAHQLYGKLVSALEIPAFHEALETIWALVRTANAYVDHQAPWALRKSDPERMKTVLYCLAETIRHIAILLQPFMPQSMAQILDQLGVDERGRSFEALASEHALVPGSSLPKPKGVFPRFVDPDENS
jgi:methionyl-tRNA synthetase